MAALRFGHDLFGTLDWSSSVSLVINFEVVVEHYISHSLSASGIGTRIEYHNVTSIAGFVITVFGVFKEVCGNEFSVGSMGKYVS